MFKKITEGLEIFDAIYERHQSATNSSQKDKLEADLKKEIKKLQRFREQVKNWQNGTEIKDKSSLIDHRKLVEVAMEKYKDVEKGSKLKAYSDISLAAIDKPEVVNEATEFIQTALDSLQQQTESMESEMDKLTSGKKGKKKDFVSEERKRELVELLSTHQWHMEKLETIMRLLQNEILDTDSVMEISDDIQYYIDENENPDFIYDDSIYDELDLDVEIDEEAEINDINEENATSANTTVINQSTPPTSSDQQPQLQQTPSSSQLPQQKQPSLVSASSFSHPPGPTRKLSEMNEKRSGSRSSSIPIDKQTVHQISVNANNQTSITTLKPAPAPVANKAMNWSAAISTPQPAQQTIPQQPSQKQQVVTPAVLNGNTNATNAHSVLESLKKQKPEPLSPMKPSTPLPQSTPVQSGVQTPSPSKLNLQQQQQQQQLPIQSQGQQLSTSSPITVTKFTPLPLGHSPSALASANKPNFRYMPPGLQNFIFQISQLSDNSQTTYSQFGTVNFTPKGTFPPASLVTQLHQSWSKLVSNSTDLRADIVSLGLGDIFYGWYYGRSGEERLVCKERLESLGWILKENEWFLPKQQPADEIQVFDVSKWGVVEKQAVMV